ncbi:hypothetical protein SLS62_000271 [Diatrype stigma]|uniref:Peptidase metallopeptidase domain-containing protein n=1 Tax=Diatrype stigma TaxID=117547 RepID=A0AAN9YSY5_9PEZI
MATKTALNQRVKSWSFPGGNPRPQVELRDGDDSDVVIDDEFEGGDTLQPTEDTPVDRTKNQGNHFPKAPVPMVFKDQLEDGSSSVITSEHHGPKSSLFDTGDRRTIDECGSTEPTSVGPDEVLSRAKELNTKSSEVVQEDSADEDALLLSDLDIDEDSLGESQDSEHQEDIDDALDLENTNFAPNEEVTTALNDFVDVEATLKQPPSPVAETGVPASRCATEESSLGPVDEINLGLHNTIWRWEPNSNIEFNVDSYSFPPSVDMVHAKKSLNRAAWEWNKGVVGVQFVPVANDKPAVFQLAYFSGSDGGTLARSFIPKAPDVLERLQKLFVFPLSFTQEHKPNMTNIFYHELGHILGLRHEFTSPAEARVRSVRWGDSNPRSVMNYYRDYSSCRIQPSDYASVRDFYKFQGAEYMGFRICDLAPRRFKAGPPPTWNFGVARRFPQNSW